MEKIILVDIFDRQIGAAEKTQAHNTPLLHRAFSVFVYHDGKMLLQKRAAHKYHSGGLWTNACCSHPRENELLEEAVRRRLYEEIGVQSADLRQLFSFVYMHKFNEDLYEYEYDHVYLSEYSGSIAADPDEIDKTEWVSFDDLSKRLVESPEIFTPWFLISAPRVLFSLTV